MGQAEKFLVTTAIPDSQGSIRANMMKDRGKESKRITEQDRLKRKALAMHLGRKLRSDSTL